MQKKETQKTGQATVGTEKSRKKPDNLVMRTATLGLFAALIVLMGFTPLGYLKTAFAEISFIAIPVAVGAVLLGPSGGAILGGVFGLTSFIQALGASAFGAALFAINPVLTAVLCFVPRILMGLLGGLLGRGLAKAKGALSKDAVRSGIVCFSVPLFNTILFMSGLVLFFWNSDYIQGFAAGASVPVFVLTFVGINGVLEIAASLVIGTAISCALLAVNRRLGNRAL